MRKPSTYSRPWYVQALLNPADLVRYLLCRFLASASLKSRGGGRCPVGLGRLRLPFASTSSAQTLHDLYLLHRSSLLSIHLAEVLFAQHQPVSLSTLSAS